MDSVDTAPESVQTYKISMTETILWAVGINQYGMWSVAQK